MKLLVLAGNSLSKIKSQYPQDQILSVGSVDSAIAALRSAYYDSVVVAEQPESSIEKIKQFGVPIIYFESKQIATISEEPQYSSPTAMALKSLQTRRDITQLSSKVAVLEHQAEDREARIDALERYVDQLERDVCGDAKNPGLSDRIRQLESLIQQKEAKSFKQQDSLQQWKLWAAGAVVSLICAGLALVPSYVTNNYEQNIPDSVRKSLK